MSATATPALPGRVLHVAEQRTGLGFPLHAIPDWPTDAPWVVHGITTHEADMSVFGSAPTGEVLPRWLALRNALGCRAIVHARQVHGAHVLVHDEVPDGIVIADAADGHATAHPGVLLAVSVADCVPIYVVAPDVRAIALLHAGWRGVAAGIVERGVAALASTFGATPARLRIHCGPAICGSCFEVGPEVPPQLGLAAGPSHVDLRAVIAHRVVAHGVPSAHVTISSLCTRCGNSPFYSHRGGCAERQIAVLAIRA